MCNTKTLDATSTIWDISQSTTILLKRTLSKFLFCPIFVFVPFLQTVDAGIPIDKMHIPLTQHSSMRENPLSGAGELLEVTEN